MKTYHLELHGVSAVICIGIDRDIQNLIKDFREAVGSDYSKLEASRHSDLDGWHDVVIKEYDTSTKLTMDKETGKFGRVGTVVMQLKDFITNDWETYSYGEGENDLVCN